MSQCSIPDCYLTYEHLHGAVTDEEATQIVEQRATKKVIAMSTRVKELEADRDKWRSFCEKMLMSLEEISSGVGRISHRFSGEMPREQLMQIAKEAIMIYEKAKKELG